MTGRHQASSSDPLPSSPAGVQAGHSSTLFDLARATPAERDDATNRVGPAAARPVAWALDAPDAAATHAAGEAASGETLPPSPAAKERGMSAVDLWARYASNPTPELRNRLILQYGPLVKYVVGRLAINLPVVIDQDDILSYGALGLIDALDRFNPSLGVKFETFAIARIRGAILDALRSADPVPRSAREKVRKIERAFAHLAEQLGRQPTDAEVASYVGMDASEYELALLYGSCTIISLDNLLDADDEDGTPLVWAMEDTTQPSPPDRVEQREVVFSLRDALQALPERERLILSLYYHDELTMKEISRVLRISESRVCQLHARALVTLRAMLRQRTQRTTEIAA